MNPISVGQEKQEKEILDTADLRIVDMLCKMSGTPDDTSLRTVLTDLALACAEGSLCLPVNLLAPVGATHGLPLQGSPSESKPLILHENRLYFHRHFHAEKNLAEGLLSRLRLDPISVDLQTARSVFQEILETKPLRTQGADSVPIQLTERQKWALAAATRERIFLLTGGPGTGKTALTTSLLRALIRLRNLAPHRIRLCAPTGRAAQRLQESLHNNLRSISQTEPDANNPDGKLLQIPVETLHRLLGYQPSNGRFARNPGDPLQADLVLLDEASMADAFTLSALIQALPLETTLILVGDADQLPAVEAGSILSELLPTNRQPGLSPESWKWISECFPENNPHEEVRFPLETIPTVILDRSHRSVSGILELADAINKGDADTVLQKPRLSAPDEDYPAALPDLIQRYAQSLFLEQHIDGRTYVECLRALRNPLTPEEENQILTCLFKFLDASRILACTRYGGLGCERVNTLARRKLEPLFEERTGIRDFGGFHGAPLLITRNDMRTGLSNGEIGIWLRGSAGLTACFRRGGEWLRFPAAFLPPWELAFATTVHKSQGSECDAILLVLPEAGNRLLTREILYTAVTRARKTADIFGSEAALLESLRERVPRHSGLRGYFRGD